MSWSDPLRHLGNIPPHPAPTSLSDINSELSSTPPDTERWFEFRDDAVKVLDLYAPNGPDDDTAKVLNVFIMKLPKEGQLALMSEILLLRNDGAKLRQLRNFLVDTLL